MNPETPKLSEQAHAFLSATERLIDLWHERPLCHECNANATKARMTGMMIDFIRLLNSADEQDWDTSNLIYEVAEENDIALLLKARCAVEPKSDVQRPGRAEDEVDLPIPTVGHGVERIAGNQGWKSDEDEATEGQAMPEHAAYLLSQVLERIAVWRSVPADDLDGPDYLLSRLQGLAASMVSLLDCAGDHSETVDALYELNEVRDIGKLIREGEQMAPFDESE